ncbi:MAG: sigma-70 family RNA polymerase sigma factor [Hyphomonadaceae bacterium]
MADEQQLRAWLLQGLAGDEAAHRAFLCAAASLLRAFFRNRLRGAPEDAEDLVQETLVALHTRRQSYDPAYPLTAWMYAIARYRLIDFIRRKKRRGIHVDLDGVDPGAPDQNIEASDASRDVAVLLAKLPPKQQQAIRLVKLEEKSVREAAALTGFSEPDIKISIHRGMKALMRLMAEEQAP